MKKYKMKVIIQSKENISDTPETNQFSSGVFTDVSDIIPDLLSFLKDIEKTKDIIGDVDTSELDLPKLELPQFERLINKEKFTSDTQVNSGVESVMTIPVAEDADPIKNEKNDDEFVHEKSEFAPIPDDDDDEINESSEDTSLNDTFDDDADTDFNFDF